MAEEIIPELWRFSLACIREQELKGIASPALFCKLAGYVLKLGIVIARS